MNKLQSSLAFLVVCSFLLCFSACQKDGEDTVVHIDQNEFSPEDRIMIGAQLDKVIQNQTNTFHLLNSANNTSYAELQEYLNTLFLSLVNTDVVEHRNSLDWGVKVIMDDESKNAFITPGGMFYITTGLMKVIQTEHELISIMGHEILYVDGDILMEKLKKEYSGDILGDIILGNDPPQTIDIAMSLKDISYDVSQVLDADIFAIDIICDFLYNPQGMKDFLERNANNAEQISWIQNRPSSDDRLVIIQQSTGGCGPGNTFEERYQNYLKILP